MLQRQELGGANHIRWSVEFCQELRCSGDLVCTSRDNQAVTRPVSIKTNSLRVGSSRQQLPKCPHQFIRLRVRKNEGLDLNVRGGRTGVKLGNQLLYFEKCCWRGGDHERVGTFVGTKLRSGKRISTAAAAEKLLQRVR